MSSSSSDDIAAYLAHLKQSTAVKPKATRGYISPAKDSSPSYVLSPSPSKLSPVKKSSLRSPQKTSVSANIQKYQDKYVKKPGKLLVRRSSVVFSVPNGQAGSSGEHDPTDSATTEDSLMDDVLAKCLQETSISDEPEEFEGPSGGASDKARVLPAPLPSKMKVTNDTMVGDKSKKLSVSDASTNLPAKPNNERKLGKGRLLQEASRPKSAENYKLVKHKTSDGRSLSFENSDLKSVPEEDFADDRTLSTTPDRSHKSPLLKQTKSVFRSSAIKDDDSTSTSSSSQQYLSKRISRRNSYIYKEECDLVSATSSNETIKTDPELLESLEMLELETDEPESEATPPEPPKLSSEIENEKLSHQTLTQKPVRDLQTEKIDSEVSLASRVTLTEKNRVTAGKHDYQSEVDASNTTSKPASVVSLSNEYSSSDFEPSSGSKSSRKSSSNISHKVSNQTRSSNSGSEKSRRIPKERRSKRHREKKKPPSSSSYQTSNLSSSSEESKDYSSVQRHREKKKRHKENKRKHSHKSSRHYSCVNCERMRDLLWGAPRLPWPLYDGSNAFMQHVAAGYPVSRDQGVTNVSSNVTRIEDALRQTIILGRQFLLSQRTMYDAYCATLTSSYRYTTLHGIERMIGQNRKATPTLSEAYQKADKDLLNQMRGK